MIIPRPFGVLSDESKVMGDLRICMILRMPERFAEFKLSQMHRSFGFASG